MSKKTVAEKIANIFGSFGYFGIIIEWLFFFAVVALPWIESSPLRNIFVPKGDKVHGVGTNIGAALPQSVQVIFAVLALIFCLAIIVYAIYTIPRSIGKMGKGVTQSSAKIILGNIERKQPLAKSEEKKIVFVITWSLKILLAILPFILIFLPGADQRLPHDVALIIGGFLAAVSLFWFALQYIVVRIVKLPAARVW